MQRILLLTLFTLAVSFAHDPSLDESWEDWKTTFARSYEPQEEILRRAVWEENLALIVKHNSEYSLGKHAFTLRMNHLGDLVRVTNYRSSQYKFRFACLIWIHIQNTALFQRFKNHQNKSYRFGRVTPKFCHSPKSLRLIWLFF